jgi:nucleoside-diphosphate-sugar epimerase
MRVAAQFARKALAGEDIELHTAGASMANCCYAADAVRGMLTILLKGKAGEAYNVSNPRACVTIRQMAEVVAQKVCGGRIKVKIDVPEDVEKRGYASDVGYVINADKLMGLGWSPKFGLEEMFGRMVEEWGGGRLCP